MSEIVYKKINFRKLKNNCNKRNSSAQFLRGILCCHYNAKAKKNGGYPECLAKNCPIWNRLKPLNQEI